MDYSKFPSQAPTRKAWQGMMNRCYTVTNKGYPQVGGAGIRVCDTWRAYEQFLFDMGEKPDGSVLSRHDNTKDFSPENVYWKPKVFSRANPIYSIWKGVKRRCGLMGHASHAKAYQLRGITMDPDWAEDFNEFAAAVGARPSDAHQLDRVDNDLGYVPGNVRWALPKENANNRSDNIYVEMNGERKTLQEWAETFGILIPTIHTRWAALFAAPKRKPKCVQVDLRTGTVLAVHDNIAAAAAATGIKYGTVAKCLSGGNASAGGYAWRYVD